MREMSWNGRALLAAGVAVVTLGLAGQAPAEELTDVSPLTTPHATADPSERPAAVLDAETPMDERQEVGASKARTESPCLPTPADDVEPPPPPDFIPEVIFPDSVVGEQITITLTPRLLRRPRHLP